MDEPLRLPCGLELPHRVALAPLTNTQSHPDGTLGEDERRWLLRRAEGGFRWISTCAAFVSEEGHAWRGQLGISDDRHLDGLRRLADDLHAAGSLAVVQLHHGGPQAKLAPEGPLGAVAGPNGQRAASADDLARVIADFVAAASRAEAAGFDGVEIHGANGYVFTHFLSPTENLRTDAYGGDLVGRARLLRETMRAVRASVSNRFAVGVRLSPVDLWGQRGLRLVDSVQVGAWLAEDGADFVHLSLGDAASVAPEDPDGPPIARVFRDRLPAEVPVFAAGGIWTRADLERARAAGVDVGVLGRAAIGNPDWPARSREDGWTPLRPPFEPEALRRAAVGSAFLDYLSTMSGLLVGGRAARD